MLCERGADYVLVYALPRTWDGKENKHPPAKRVVFHMRAKPSILRYA